MWRAATVWARGGGVALALAASASAGIQALPGPHDLRPQPRHDTDGAACGFCHIPADRDARNPNRLHIAAPATFATLDTTAAGPADAVPGPASVVCLACHDGAQAGDGAMTLAAFWPAGGANRAPGPATGDHPVGISFAAALEPGAVPRLQRGGDPARPQWWLDLEPVPNGRRDSTDLILFTRGEGALARPFIECASCHDPHGAPGAHLLRSAAAPEASCRACHDL